MIVVRDPNYFKTFDSMLKNQNSALVWTADDVHPGSGFKIIIKVDQIANTAT